MRRIIATLALCAVSATAQADPAAIYASTCASCHGDKGRADGPAAAGLAVQPADFGDPNFWTSVTYDELKKAIKEGGASVGKSPLMVPFGDQLDDTSIAAMVDYLRSFEQSEDASEDPDNDYGCG